MAADRVADGDYLGEYSRFFAEFVARVNPDDQLPVKVSVYDVNESELVGEIINVTLQYLNRIYCPPSLQSYIARLVIEAIKSTCKKQPEICGLRQQEKTYAPLKLMQAVTNEVNEICRRYLDNSRLALLPPPSSTPQVTVGAIRNARRKMEDRHMILHDLNTMFNIQDDTIVDYYAVFDGHGGQDAAAYCATHLHQYLVESVHYPTDPERALRDAFLTTDAQFIAKSSTQKLNGGTTAVCVLLINKKLYIAWVGDSMASLVTCGKEKQLVNPHRPTREDESERIRNMGGVVVHCMGVLRVNGFLSISRAIGDVLYKPYISGEPEVRCVSLDGTEDFLIIACDGLWDYVDQKTAALRVYRQVLLNPYDLKHVHQALLQSAKLAGSLDNITVIVVFLTPPIKIASRSNSFHQAPNDLLLNNMDPNNPIPSNHDQFDVKSSYIKQLMDDGIESLHSNQFDVDLLLKNSMCGMTRNGKHRNDDDEEYDYTDIGPETDVDAGEDVHDNNYPLAASSSLIDPSPESEKSPMEIEKQNDDDKNDNDYSNRDNANVYSVDSVVDDGDVDNRARPSDRDVRGADNETLRDNGDNDDARVETAGTDTVADDDESPPSPQAAKPVQHELIVADNVADSEDSEDEWDYYRVDPNKQESAVAVVTTDESRKDIEEQSAQENPESVTKDSSEIESPEAKDDIKCEELVNTSSSELIDILVSDEIKSNASKEDQILSEQKEKKEQYSMDFQLNPDAAEFVPTSPTLLANKRSLLQDFAISGSPLKQTQAMDDISIPSQSEFDKEVCYRPKEIGEEFPHSEPADLQNNSSQSMDTSEISSTKAEMGDDESMMHISQWQSQWNEKTTVDDAESDSEEDDIVVRNNAMVTSIFPENLVDKSVDLNAVHMLDDSSDEQENTPSRSPEPCANPTNEDRPRTPDDKSSVNVLCSSTPQPPEDFENLVSTMNSEINSETKDSSLSEVIQEKQFLPYDMHEYSQDSNPLTKVMDSEVNVEEYLLLSDEPQVKDDCLIQSEKQSVEKACEEDTKLTEENKEEEKEELCKIEDDTSFIMKPVALSLQDRSQDEMIEDESMESKVSMNLLDSTNHLNDETQITEQSILEQTSLRNSETTPDTEQTHHNADFENLSEKMDVKDVKEDFKIENDQSNQSTDWTDYSKTENSQLKNVDFEFAYEFAGIQDNSQFENRKQEIEKLCDKDEDDSEDKLPTHQVPIIESQLFDNFEEAELQNEKVSTQHEPISELDRLDLIVMPTEEQQVENKIPDFAPISINEVFKEKVTSEDVPSKEEEIESRETAEASSENITTLDKSKEEIIEVVGASVGAVVAATVAAVAIASPTKKTATTTSAKRSTKTMTTPKTIPTTKTVTKSPTSPSKTMNAAVRATATLPAQSIAKKSATSTTTRPKQLDGSTKMAVSSINGKTTTTKTTTKVATRTSVSPRVNSSTMKSKTTTTTTLAKVSGTPIEKKSTMSGDAKSISKSTTSTKPTSASLKPITTSTTTKTTLVKTSSTTAKTSTSNVTSKPRPASATSALKTTSTSKPSITGVNGASRPRTAPTSGSATKLRESTGRTTTAAKSPLIDKQSKETVNKQISRSGASPLKTSRASAPIGTATSATKTRTLPGKSTASAISPTKKTLTSKIASRTSSAATKRLSSDEAKVLQNGISKDVTKAAVITATNKPEDDIPRKDASPVNVQMDNQLIAD